MKTKIIFLLSLLPALFFGQTDLVRWNGANNNFNPYILVSNNDASDITNEGGVSLSNNGQWNQHFQTGNCPNPQENAGYLDESRYVQFTITPDTNYQIDLSECNFEVQM